MNNFDLHTCDTSCNTLYDISDSIFKLQQVGVILINYIWFLKVLGPLCYFII